MTHEVAKEQHHFVVAADMVERSIAIGITVERSRALPHGDDAAAPIASCPVRQANADGEQNEYHRTKEIGLVAGIDEWVRLFTDQREPLLQGLSRAGRALRRAQWPDLKPAKIFRLAFRDKGRLIDSRRARAVQEVGGA